MKLPPGLDIGGGLKGKGTVDLTSARNTSPNTSLQEFAMQIEGNTATCYVLTAPGDVIDVDFAFNPHVADFADVIIDGVRRRTHVSKAAAFVFRSSFDRGLFLSRGKDGKRGGLKNCHFQVKAQDHSEDIEIDDDAVPSALGSIMVQLFRKTGGKASDEPVERYPDFEQCATWMETANHNIFHANDVPSLEIDLVEPTKGTKAMREQTQKVFYSGEYKLLTTLVFLLRTAEELRAMGKFDNVPDYIAPPFITAGEAAAAHKAYKGDAAETKKDAEPVRGSVLGTDGERTPSCHGQSVGEENASKSAGEVEKNHIKEHDAHQHLQKPLGKVSKDSASIASSLGSSVHEGSGVLRTKRSLSDNGDGMFVEDTDQEPTTLSTLHNATHKMKKPKALFGSPLYPATVASVKQTNALDNADGNLEEEDRDDVDNIDEAELFKYDGLPNLSFEVHDAAELLSGQNENWIRKSRNASPCSNTSTELAPLEDVIAAARSSRRIGSGDDLNTAFSITPNEFGSSHKQEVSTNPSDNVFDSSQELGSSEQHAHIKNRLKAEASTSEDNVDRTVEFSAEDGNKNENHDEELPTEQPSPRKLLPTSKPDSKSGDAKPASTKAIKTASKSTKSATEAIKEASKAAAGAKASKPAEKAKAASATKKAEKRKSTADTAAKPAKKRKTSAVNEVKSLEEPEQITMSPGRERIEKEIQAAKDRVKAAEQRKKELQAEMEAAVLAQKDRQKAQEMLSQAAEIERENAEMEAKIAALYAMDG